ncbi:MAG: hypothetical protein EB120_10450 [Proteobacteria bacterium]|nr:hypothetical protein [Pseudomonadota bacterium]NDG27577.1 hypothetical protein [Pseudomonadota bacterium]
MEETSKIKTWIQEQAPMLQVLYQNKYVGMIYDRFASLPPPQQRKMIFGTMGLIAGSVALYLLVAYYSLWSISNRARDASAMGTHLQEYQKIRRDKSQLIGTLEGNSILAPPGQMKQKLMDMGRITGISPRMMSVNEAGEASARSEDGKPSSELKIKQATVSLQKVTLTQLVNYLKNIESGQYSLSISSFKIQNDSKLRGYMNVELQVMAYLFAPEEP